MIYREAMQAAQRLYWQSLLDQRLSMSEIAKVAGLHRSTAYENIRKCGLDPTKAHKRGRYGNHGIWHDEQRETLR